MNPSANDAENDNTAKVFALIFVLLVGGGYLAYVGVRAFLSGLTEKYTDTAPLELPAPEASEAEIQAVIDRMRAFEEHLENNPEPVGLSLSARDINILINHHPSWTELAGKVHVVIEDDKIKGTVSFPVTNVSGPLQGRYLNGFAVFRVGLAEGLLEVYVDSIEMGGEPLPETVMKFISSTNLASDADLDAQSEAFLRRIESLNVSDGQLHILVKPGAASPVSPGENAGPE